ncbi:hypothetical protein JCM10212_004068 [Sporobolomyces blumeae]
MSTSTAPSPLDSLRRDVIVSQQYLAVWVAILFWDTFAMFPSEYKYIWKQRRWTPMKILFLANRYWIMVVQIIGPTMILARIPTDVCKRMFWIQEFMTMTAMLLCDMIILVRVYAVYNQSKKVLAFLALLMVIEAAIMLSAGVRLSAQFAPPGIGEYIGFVGCVAGGGDLNHILLACMYWLPPVVFNLIAFGMLLLRDVKVTRKAGKIPILRRLVQHGAIYLLLIVAANVPNALLYLMNGVSIVVLNLNVPESLTMTSLMCSRMVLALFESHETQPQTTHANKVHSDPSTVGKGKKSSNLEGKRSESTAVTTGSSATDHPESTR